MDTHYIHELGLMGEKHVMTITISRDELSLLPTETLHELLENNVERENYESCALIKSVIDNKK